MRIVFVDFDKTLIRKDSGAICAWPSLKKKIITKRYFIKLAKAFLFYQLRIKTRSELQLFGFQFYKGRSRQQLAESIRALWDQYMRNFLSPAVMRALDVHREQGDRIVILTASARLLVEPFLSDLRIEDAIGTELEFREGICTGKIVGPIVEGEIKKRYAQSYAQQKGLDLESCVFYSDHSADLPLLESVGLPVAVCPDRTLRKIALKKGWRILEH